MAFIIRFGPKMWLCSIFVAVCLLAISQNGVSGQGSCPDGTPSTVTCTGGRPCPSDHLCTNTLCCPSCNRKLKDLPAVPPPGMLVPRCDPSGNYSAEQCQGSTGQCWCANEIGEEIPGTRVLPGDFRARNCDQERQRYTSGSGGSSGLGSGSGAGAGSGVGAGAGPIPGSSSFPGTSGTGFGATPGSGFGNSVEGECPPAVGFGVCLNRCTSDADCARDGRKCCSNGCGKQCMLPVVNRPGGNPGSLETKAGSCPINASPDLSRPSTVKDECNNDNGCIGVQKCCFTTGGYRCLNPVGDVGSDNKPGFCPPLPAGIASSTFRIDHCQKDSECTGSQKCCDTTSGKTCHLPTTQPQVTPQEGITNQCDNVPNEVFEQCISPCPIACDNQDNPPSCPGQHCVPGCTCRLGYIRTSSKDPKSSCVPRTQCPPSGSSGNIGPGGISGTGPSAVPPNPASLNTNFSKVGVCPTGDLNPQITQSINNGQATACTQDSQCPADQKCCSPPGTPSQPHQPTTGSINGNTGQRCLCPDPNAIWRQCGTSCPETCPEHAPSSNAISCGSQCTPGCYCLDGYVKLNSAPNAPCVPRSQCPTGAGSTGSGAGSAGSGAGAGSTGSGSGAGIGSSSTGTGGLGNNGLNFGPGPGVVSGGFVTGANSKAIARLSGNGTVDGVITFTQFGNQVQITGTVRGLTPGQHGFHIHTSGDISSNCANIGDHYNPDNRQHGGPQDQQRHLGDLGNINADKSGAALVSIVDNQISLYGTNSIIGRTLAVHEHEDDLGHGSSPESRHNGNSGNVVACGVIGFSN